uniref:glycogenin glucosyltransferase n=1 Tax=Setaria digitata TaxID=48799 RepID=A0A915PWF9_9BILA
MTEAWVTLATSDGYAVGALVLAHSLRVQGTTRKLHCMITTSVSQQLREELAATFDAISIVDVLDSGDTANLRLISRPELGVTFTKIHCWRLTQYTKCVFLDADCLVLQNPDELFDHDELSAVADIGWPDCFNSGVFVYRPSEQTYLDILNFALEHGSFDGGDQGLLNQFFKGWRDKPPAFRLPFIYNMTSGAIYTYLAAYKKYASQVKIVHFLGPIKPWQQLPSDVHFSEHLAYWWSLFRSRLSSSIATSHVSSPRSSPSTQRTTELIFSRTPPSATVSTTIATSTTTTISASTPFTSNEVTSTYGRRSTPAIPSHRGLPDPFRMRVFRCVPPTYEAWRPLRHPPTHLAQQMAVFSLGPTVQLCDLNAACSEIPGVAFEGDQSSAPTDEERMRAWEVGHPDYLGADAYENIQKAIDHALE